jgi:nucleoside-diphosphate-sugar epimerase
MKNFYKNKRVLVTGGAGFIGSHLAEALYSLGAKVTIFDNLNRKEESLRNLNELKSNKVSYKFINGDVLDFSSVKKAVQSSDIVFHLAALPSHRLALSQPRDYAQVDIMGTVNILESARLMKNPPKIMFASSNKVYGKQKPPFREDSLLFPEGPYGQAKADAEEWCKQYAKYYNIPVFVARYFHVIGPRSQPDLATSIFVERAINKQDLIVHGDFKGKKFTPCAAAFTNIYDCITGSLTAMQKVNSFDILNIGAWKETTIYDLADIIRKRVGNNVNIIKKQMFPHESLHHASDPTKSKRLLGWEAKTPVEISVNQYVEWRLKTGERKSAEYKEKL